MGILQRFKKIIRAKVNAKLSKTKEVNEEDLLNKYIYDAKEALRQIKSEMALVEAKESACFNKLCENEKLYERYYSYASNAITSNNDSDARNYLMFCNKLNTEKITLLDNYKVAKNNTVKMKEITEKLVDDLEKTIINLEELKQKNSMANQLEKLNDINNKINYEKLGDFDSLIDKIHNKIYVAEAIADLNSEAEYKLIEENNSNDLIDIQLQKLKDSLKA